MSSSLSPRPSAPRTGHVNPRPVPTRRRAALLTAGMAAALVLGACTGDDDDDDKAPRDSPAAATDTAPPAAPIYARYVALGDSFAAFGPTAAPTSGPEGCLRSSANYASLLAQRGDIGELVDVTCGGAQSPDMTAPQIAETPPQFTALTAETDLVTLSIGGNDIGFGEMVGCILQTPRVQTGAPCRDRLELSVTEALNGLGARLDEVYAGIRERSPEARIIATAYMPLVPDHGTCEFVSGMSPGDVTWARHVTDRVNMIVSDAAARAGADVAMPGDAAERHACAPAPERYTDFTGAETGSHPMHPTAAGQRAMADAVGAIL